MEPPPISRKSSGTIAWAIAAVVLIGVALFLYFKMRPAEKVIVPTFASATPTATTAQMVAQSTTTPPVPTSSPTASSGRSPELSRDSIAEAEKYEAARDWPRAVMAYVK